MSRSPEVAENGVLEILDGPRWVVAGSAATGNTSARDVTAFVADKTVRTMYLAEAVPLKTEGPT